VRDSDPARWQERQDQTGMHVMLRHADGGSLVAATRLSVYEEFEDMPGSSWFSRLTEQVPGPVGVIGRLVVHTDLQRRGVGRWLDSLLIQISRQCGCKSVFCDVPPYRVDTLKRMGFRQIMAPKAGPALPDITWTAMCLHL
ncbi:MAG: GNAT family N-acetyltransferase, partial [archaeon]|nr:GNAT family N-acetyltransferase [archaeon]